MTARPSVLLREVPSMQKVNGIGGLFFTASDPDGNPVQPWQPA